MNSKKPGKTTLEPEITHISSHGVWLLSNDRESFMPFELFPWFKDATIGQILNVEEPARGYFYWPELDIDLSVDIIENPEKYPLISK